MRSLRTLTTNYHQQPPKCPTQYSDPPYPALAVSLSGGVDSMVIAWLLKHFAPAYG